MKIASVFRRLRSAPKYAYWHISVRLLRNQQSGPGAAKLGHALRQIGRWAEAEAAYRVALKSSREPAPSKRLELARASWSHELSVILSKQEKHEAAYRAARDACAADDTPLPHAWQLRCTAKKVESNVGIVLAGQQIRRSGICTATLLWELAEAYTALSHWAEAKEALTSYVRIKPNDAEAQLRLGRICALIAKWRGTFTGPVDGGREALVFTPIPETARESDLSVVTCRKAALKAFVQATTLKPRRIRWRSGLADAHAAVGDLEKCIAAYEEALGMAEKAKGTWTFAVKHRWQYKIESARASLGEARVEDPHFDCAVTVPEPVPAPTAGRIPGLFFAQITYSGLHLSGLVSAVDCQELTISLDGVPIRRVKVDNSEILGTFVYAAGRNALPYFPVTADITVTTADGQPLQAAAGGDLMRLSIPHGDGSAMKFARSGHTLDKKGGIPYTSEQTRDRQDRYLRTYARVREFFETELDKSLFLIYGTLLGYHREGDFIKGDDDFDGGWISAHSEPQQVKAEAFDIIVELVKAGFVVSFNRRGRLLRVQLAEEVDEQDMHLDLHPIWFRNGNVWLHNNCSFPATREDFLPVTTGKLRDIEVAVPAATEKFLRNQYGASWNVPDPGFTYHDSDVHPSVLRHLSEALITIPEYRDLADRVKRETAGNPDAGRFFSVGSQEFYPLGRFIG
ncbi:tetratricopeptide repeat protein [Stackebrandtia endophytica]|uniref:Tetratricopeptide repeat protein n=1 Tax=Stackebrandtia endophytica TaxID=1496996 RepID=A0A543AZR6_9ACTN|nr:hypothetical protein [Stackebrandtia endophytica]TQL78046.1 tetratricopeptide repeat protein [Stackebrandtia endophytica]